MNAGEMEPKRESQVSRQLYELENIAQQLKKSVSGLEDKLISVRPQAVVIPEVVISEIAKQKKEVDLVELAQKIRNIKEEIGVINKRINDIKNTIEL